MPLGNLALGETPFAETQRIQSWIKENAKWWIAGQITDKEFSKGLEYLIDHGIIVIPPTEILDEPTSEKIPTWIKENAKWWIEESITEKEFVDGVQHLVKNKIIQLKGVSTEPILSERDWKLFQRLYPDNLYILEKYKELSEKDKQDKIIQFQEYQDARFAVLVADTQPSEEEKEMYFQGLLSRLEDKKEFLDFLISESINNERLQENLETYKELKNINEQHIILIKQLYESQEISTIKTKKN